MLRKRIPLFHHRLLLKYCTSGAGTVSCSCALFQRRDPRGDDRQNPVAAYVHDSHALPALYCTARKCHNPCQGGTGRVTALVASAWALRKDHSIVQSMGNPWGAMGDLGHPSAPGDTIAEPQRGLCCSRALSRTSSTLPVVKALKHLLTLKCKNNHQESKQA